MPQTLTAKQETLADIFSSAYVFTIPGYQRPYAWGTDQAQELLDDLRAALAAVPAQLSEAAPYFLGSIVLIKSDGMPDAEVVDGQQRLTTLTVLLSAIRARIKDPSVQAGITKRIYEQGDVVANMPARYRLSLRDSDQDFFRTWIQHEQGIQKLAALNERLPDAQDRLRANATLYWRELSPVSQAELVRLVQFIVTRCYLVTVATPDLDSAYRIFGVMNSRGLDLSATDILKAEIIGGITKDLRGTYTDKWVAQEEDLGREGFGDLFSHIRMVYRKAKPKSTLLKEFKEHVSPSAQPAVFIDEVMIPMARAYAELSDADYASQRFAEHVNEHLRWLNRLEFADWTPPALAFAVRHRNDPDAMLLFFQDLERLAYSMLVRKTGVNDRIERFSSLTAAVEKGIELQGIASPLQLSYQEQFDVYAALDGPLYATHSPRALAVLLLRLDRLLSDKAATYDNAVVSVEHVMPQQPAPNSQWRKWVPDPQVHQDRIHRLGNLALLSRKKNSAAGNYDFEKKKAIYFTKNGVSTFALTTAVLHHDDWTVEVMQERQQSMLSALERHWRLENRQSKAAVAQALLTEIAALDFDAQFEMESARHGVMATGRRKGGAFVVTAGSEAKLHWTADDHAYRKLREQLIADGALAVSADSATLVFTRDVDFKSPSAASATVLARPDNGRTTWRLKGTSVNYGAWESNLPAGSALGSLQESA